jgi:NADH dehydrogenase/NADH:ubiquinone oxidoreductase subunit G
MSSFLIKNKSPLMIFGLSIEKRGLSISNLELFIKSINPSTIFLNIFNNSNSIGNKILNIKSLSTNDVLKAESIFYINCKETNFIRKVGFLFDKNKESFWFNNHISECIIRNGFDIPVKNFFEETGIFLNLESRPQKTGKVLNNNNNARSYKTIFSSLFEKGLKKNIYLNFIKNLIIDPQKFNLSSKKMRLYFIKNNFSNNLTINNISNYPTKLEINNFFLSTYFSKYSNNMLIASQEFQKKYNNFF